MSVGLKKLADIHRLATPKISVDSPVEGKLEGAPVEATIHLLARSHPGETELRDRNYGRIQTGQLFLMP